MIWVWILMVWLLGTALMMWQRGERWLPRWVAWSVMCVAWGMLWPNLSTDQITATSSALHVHTDAQNQTSTSSFASQQHVWLPEAQGQGGQEAQAPDFATAKRWFAADASSASVHIHGHGLTERDRSQAATDATTLSLQTPQGWQQLSAPSQVFLGQPWVISGEWVREANSSSASAEPLTAVLLAPDGSEATRISIQSGKPWSMEVLLPTTGMHTHQLHIKQGEQTQSSVPLAVFVAQPEPIRVALMMATPSPEWKFLQRYLTDTQSLHSVSARFTPTMLGQKSWGRAETNADVTIMAWRRWLQLDDAERTMWLARVKNEGLGLLFYLQQAPDDASHTQLQILGLLEEQTQASSKTQMLTWLQQNSQTNASHTKTTHSKQPRTWPLVWSEQTQLLRVPQLSKTVGAWRAEGQGRVGLLAVADTWRWAMRGDSAQHQRFWANVIAEVTKPSEAQRLRVHPSQGREGARHWVCGAGSVTVAHQGKPANQRVLAGEQSPSAAANNENTCHPWFPRQSGWHQLSTPTSDNQPTQQQWQYVHPADWANNWHANQRWQQTQAWEKAVDEQTNGSPNTTITATQTPEHFNQWPWALLWLLSAISLWWLERRV